MTLIPGVLRRAFERLLDPFVGALVAWRIHPNVITTVGTLLLLGAGVAIGAGGIRAGGALLLLSGVFDMLDGRVARLGGRMSRFGAFYDSTLDRLGECALFTGIGVWFMRGGVPAGWMIPAVVLAIVALSASLLVSYARARAEGLGLECKVGILQRAERILGLGVPTLLFGAGPNGILLVVLVAMLAVTALVTVGQRILYVYGRTRTAPRQTQARWVTPSYAEPLQKGRQE